MLEKLRGRKPTLIDFEQYRHYAVVIPLIEKDGTYEFEVPISGRQTLSVLLERREDDWVILRWQAVTAEGTPDESLDVWKGSEDKS